MQNLCYFTVISLFFFLFEGNVQVQAPRGLYSEARFNGGSLCYDFGGGRAYNYLEGLIFGILRFYQQWNKNNHIDICCSLQFKFRSHRAKNEKVMTKTQRPCINDGATSCQDYLTTSLMFLHHCKQAFAVLSVAQERQQIKDSCRYLRLVLSAI